MSHSLSLDVMEMAEAAALLDRLASGLDELPSRSTAPSSPGTEPLDSTCCCNLWGGGGEGGVTRSVSVHLGGPVYFTKMLNHKPFGSTGIMQT